MVAARAFGLAVRVLRDHAAAEDAVHDAFEQLWRQRERIDTARGRVDALALTIVRRRALDVARRRSRQSRRSSALLPDLEVADPAVEDMATALQRGIDGAAVRSALDGLPDAQRQVLDLAYFAGLTMTEIAAKLQIPVGTAKSRARLALSRLRDEIGSRDDR